MEIGFSILLLFVCALCITILIYIGYLIVNWCLSLINYDEEKIPIIKKEEFIGSYVHWNDNDKVINYNALMD